MTTGQRTAAGPRGWILRSAHGQVSLRLDPRATVTGAVLAALLAAVAVVALSTGDYTIAPLEVVQVLLGQGERAAEFIVVSLRLPRILTAMLVGAALGVSGGVFQRLSGNPLGSPDVIGLTQGAAAGAVLQILYVRGGMLATSVWAVAGGVGAALAVYLLAYRGGVHGARLVLVGIGLGAVLRAAISYLLTRAQVEDAQAAAVWLVGSLNNRGWEHAAAAGVVVALLLPATLALGRRLSLLELGDDTARALGLAVEQTKRWLLLGGVALAAVATAAAGPIAFVALAAPQLARRVSGAAGAGLGGAGLMGALLLLASDLVAQRLLAPTQLPVGVVTAAAGGIYLAWLLTRT